MREIAFRFWDKELKVMNAQYEYDGRLYIEHGQEIGHYLMNKERFVPLQFTGLKDKNGLAEIYEGDIIDENGAMKGNIYESPQVYQEGIDCIIEGMGTEKWRNTESIAMGRGCKYSK